MTRRCYSDINMKKILLLSVILFTALAFKVSLKATNVEARCWWTGCYVAVQCNVGDCGGGDGECQNNYGYCTGGGYLGNPYGGCHCCSSERYWQVCCDDTNWYDVSGCTPSCGGSGTKTQRNGCGDSRTVNCTTSACTGTLSIATTPVNGGIYVNSIYKDLGSWSSTINTGTYTVSFGAVTNYTTPSNQSATVTTGNTTSKTGTYVLKTGTLTVNTSGADGSISVDSVSWDTGPTQSQSIVIGSHTVSCGNVSGYNAPTYSPGSDVTVSEGATTMVTCAYTLMTGNLSVNTTPTGITPSITVKDSGGSTVGSGTGPGPLSVSLTTGTYTVTFGTVTDYNPPSTNPQTVNLTTSGASVTGAYTAVPGMLKIKTNPSGAPLFVGGTSSGNSPQTLSVAPGTYIVSFGFISGYSTPSTQSAVVLSEITTNVNATYTPASGASTTPPELLLFEPRFTWREVVPF